MYDSIIIGGGIAGLTSAIYLGRAGKKILVIEKKMCGGQIVNACNINNYPGFSSISGFDLIQNIKNQLNEYDNVNIIFEEVTKVLDDKVYIQNGVYETKTIIIASGLERRQLDIPCEQELIGSGVSYCATCDGAFFKNSPVAVVGSGNTAIDEVLYLSPIASKVYLLIRGDKIKADNYTAEQIEKLNNVETIFNVTVKSLNGNPLTSISLSNDRILDVKGIFIAVGMEPNTRFLNNIVDIDEQGYIISDNTLTNKKNIFVAGDVRTKDFRQLVTASSDGAVAAKNVIKYLNN